MRKPTTCAPVLELLAMYVAIALSAVWWAMYDNPLPFVIAFVVGWGRLLTLDHSRRLRRIGT